MPKPMPLQAKTRRVTPRRRTAIVSSRRSSRHSPLRSEKSRDSKKSPVMAEIKANPATGSGYTKALRFLETLTDYERLRIVRYNAQNFDLDRMRSLLKKLGNPQDDFKTVHI